MADTNCYVTINNDSDSAFYVLNGVRSYRHIKPEIYTRNPASCPYSTCSELSRPFYTLTEDGSVYIVTAAGYIYYIDPESKDSELVFPINTCVTVELEEDTVPTITKVDGAVSFSITCDSDEEEVSSISYRFVEPTMPRIIPWRPGYNRCEVHVGNVSRNSSYTHFIPGKQVNPKDSKYMTYPFSKGYYCVQVDYDRCVVFWRGKLIYDGPYNGMGIPMTFTYARWYCTVGGCNPSCSDTITWSYVTFPKWQEITVENGSTTYVATSLWDKILANMNLDPSTLRFGTGNVYHFHYKANQRPSTDVLSYVADDLFCTSSAAAGLEIEGAAGVTCAFFNSDKTKFYGYFSVDATTGLIGSPVEGKSPITEPAPLDDVWDSFKEEEGDDAKDAILLLDDPSFGEVVTVFINKSHFDSDVTFTYQWYRIIDGTETLIEGATSRSYIPRKSETPASDDNGVENGSDEGSDNGNGEEVTPTGDVVGELLKVVITANGGEQCGESNRQPNCDITLQTVKPLVETSPKRDYVYVRITEGGEEKIAKLLTTIETATEIKELERREVDGVGEYIPVYRVKTKMSVEFSVTEETSGGKSFVVDGFYVLWSMNHMSQWAKYPELFVEERSVKSSECDWHILFKCDEIRVCTTDEYSAGFPKPTPRYWYVGSDYVANAGDYNCKSNDDYDPGKVVMSISSWKVEKALCPEDTDEISEIVGGGCQDTTLVKKYSTVDCTIRNNPSDLDCGKTHYPIYEILENQGRWEEPVWEHAAPFCCCRGWKDESGNVPRGADGKPECSADVLDDKGDPLPIENEENSECFKEASIHPYCKAELAAVNLSYIGGRIYNIKKSNGEFSDWAYINIGNEPECRNRKDFTVIGDLCKDGSTPNQAKRELPGLILPEDTDENKEEEETTPSGSSEEEATGDGSSELVVDISNEVSKLGDVSAYPVDLDIANAVILRAPKDKAGDDARGASKGCCAYTDDQAVQRYFTRLYPAYLTRPGYVPVYADDQKPEDGYHIHTGQLNHLPIPPDENSADENGVIWHFSKFIEGTAETEWMVEWKPVQWNANRNKYVDRDDIDSVRVKVPEPMGTLRDREPDMEATGLEDFPGGVGNVSTEETDRLVRHFPRFTSDMKSGTWLCAGKYSSNTFPDDYEDKVLRYFYGQKVPIAKLANYEEGADGYGSDSMYSCIGWVQVVTSWGDRNGPAIRVGTQVGDVYVFSCSEGNTALVENDSYALEIDSVDRYWYWDGYHWNEGKTLFSNLESQKAIFYQDKGLGDPYVDTQTVTPVVSEQEVEGSSSEEESQNQPVIDSSVECNLLNKAKAIFIGKAASLQACGDILAINLNKGRDYHKAIFYKNHLVWERPAYGPHYTDTDGSEMVERMTCAGDSFVAITYNVAEGKQMFRLWWTDANATGRDRRVYSYVKEYNYDDVPDISSIKGPKKLRKVKVKVPKEDGSDELITKTEVRQSTYLVVRSRTASLGYWEYRWGRDSEGYDKTAQLYVFYKGSLISSSLYVGQGDSLSPPSSFDPSFERIFFKGVRSGYTGFVCGPKYAVVKKFWDVADSDYPNVSWAGDSASCGGLGDGDRGCFDVYVDGSRKLSDWWGKVYLSGAVVEVLLWYVQELGSATTSYPYPVARSVGLLLGDGGEFDWLTVDRGADSLMVCGAAMGPGYPYGGSSALYQYYCFGSCDVPVDVWDFTTQTEQPDSSIYGREFTEWGSDDRFYEYSAEWYGYLWDASSQTFDEVCVPNLWFVGSVSETEQSCHNVSHLLLSPTRRNHFRATDFSTATYSETVDYTYSETVDYARICVGGRNFILSLTGFKSLSYSVGAQQQKKDGELGYSCGFFYRERKAPVDHSFNYRHWYPTGVMAVWEDGTVKCIDYTACSCSLLRNATSICSGKAYKEPFPDGGSFWQFYSVGPSDGSIYSCLGLADKASYDALLDSYDGQKSESFYFAAQGFDWDNCQCEDVTFTYGGQPYSLSEIKVCYGFYPHLPCNYDEAGGTASTTVPFVQISDKSIIGGVNNSDRAVIVDAFKNIYYEAAYGLCATNRDRCGYYTWIEDGSGDDRVFSIYYLSHRLIDEIKRSDYLSDNDYEEAIIGWKWDDNHGGKCCSEAPYILFNNGRLYHKTDFIASFAYPKMVSLDCCGDAALVTIKEEVTSSSTSAESDCPRCSGNSEQVSAHGPKYTYKQYLYIEGELMDGDGDVDKKPTVNVGTDLFELDCCGKDYYIIQRGEFFVGFGDKVYNGYTSLTDIEYACVSNKESEEVSKVNPETGEPEVNPDTGEEIKITNQSIKTFYYICKWNSPCRKEVDKVDPNTGVLVVDPDTGQVMKEEDDCSASEMGSFKPTGRVKDKDTSIARDLLHGTAYLTETEWLSASWEEKGSDGSTARYEQYWEVPKTWRTTATQCNDNRTTEEVTVYFPHDVKYSFKKKANGEIVRDESGMPDLMFREETVGYVPWELKKKINNREVHVYYRQTHLTNDPRIRNLTCIWLENENKDKDLAPDYHAHGVYTTFYDDPWNSLYHDDMFHWDENFGGGDDGSAQSHKESWMYYREQPAVKNILGCRRNGANQHDWDSRVLWDQLSIQMPSSDPFNSELARTLGVSDEISEEVKKAFWERYRAAIGVWRGKLRASSPNVCLIVWNEEMCYSRVSDFFSTKFRHVLSEQHAKDTPLDSDRILPKFWDGKVDDDGKDYSSEIIEWRNDVIYINDLNAAARWDRVSGDDPVDAWNKENDYWPECAGKGDLWLSAPACNYNYAPDNKPEDDPWGRLVASGGSYVFVWDRWGDTYAYNLVTGELYEEEEEDDDETL